MWALSDSWHGLQSMHWHGKTNDVWNGIKNLIWDKRHFCACQNVRKYFVTFYPSNYQLTSSVCIQKPTKKYSKILVAFVRMGESDDSVLFSFTFFVLSNGRQKVWCGEVRSQTFAVEIQRLLKCNPSDQHLKNIAVSTHTKMQNNWKIYKVCAFEPTTFPPIHTQNCWSDFSPMISVSAERDFFSRGKCNCKRGE